MTEDLVARWDCVSASWTAQQRLHPGNVAWSHSRGDGSPDPDATLTWGDPLVCFADIWQDASPGGAAEVSLHVSPRAAREQRSRIVQALLAVAARTRVPPPLGSQQPSRSGALCKLGLEVTGDEAGSSYSVDEHRVVTATSAYRPELDLVAVGPDGDLVAYALRWLDERSHSVLLEPVGTDPAHSGRGLARALCAQMLRRARQLGAEEAVGSFPDSSRHGG